jgi:5-methylcytosine-specific restriction enzyme A
MDANRPSRYRPHESPARAYSTRVDAPRVSAARRGYDRRWRRFRDRYLAMHPWCEDCQSAGRATLAAHVHHRRSLRSAPHLKYDTENLAPLCATCHQRRTARGE